MTQIATSEPTTNVHPSDILMNLVVNLLAPMFLCATGGDIGIARLAAAKTVNAYRAQNQADLISIAQIIAYGLAALGSLSLSMADDLSVSMTLRLRASANALTRSAERNRAALQPTKSEAQATPSPKPQQSPEIPKLPDQSALIASVTAARQLAAESPTAPNPPAAAETPPRNQALWAKAMITEADKLTAGLLNLPPAEREQASFRAAALTTTANSLLAARTIASLQPVIQPPPPAAN